jgi:D-3-phosphoglycerate dehydrogenase
MKKILIVQPIHKEGIKLLEKEAKIKIASNTDKETLVNEVKDCDAILVRDAKVPAEVILNASKLKVIGRHGAGVDNIDMKVVTERRILVVNAPEANVNSVAEHVLCMILALTKNLVMMDREVREGRFASRSKVVNMEISRKKVGIIGLGKNGFMLAKMLRALNAEIIAYDPYIDPSSIEGSGIKLVQNINYVYLNSDIISLHLPLTEETKGMIGMKEFKKMKKDAYIVNASRGLIIKENELCEALKKKEIKGAALDVFEEEPLKINNPLLRLENIILSPHNAALTEEALIKMAIHSAQGILDYFNGKQPKYMVNPEVIK